MHFSFASAALAKMRMKRTKETKERANEQMRRENIARIMKIDGRNVDRVKHVYFVLRSIYADYKANLVKRLKNSPTCSDEQGYADVGPYASW